MGFKWFTVIIGALWWAFGATLDLTVAFGSGGTIIFSVMLVLSFYFLYRTGFRRNKSKTDLWVIIFRVLSIEAVLFSLAILVLGLTTPEVFTAGTTLKDLFVDYGIPGLVMAGLFWFNSWLLNTHWRRMYEQLEESKRLRLDEHNKVNDKTNDRMNKKVNDKINNKANTKTSEKANNKVSKGSNNKK